MTEPTIDPADLSPPRPSRLIVQTTDHSDVFPSRPPSVPPSRHQPCPALHGSNYRPPHKHSARTLINPRKYLGLRVQSKVAAERDPPQPSPWNHMEIAMKTLCSIFTRLAHAKSSMVSVANSKGVTTAAVLAAAGAFGGMTAPTQGGIYRNNADAESARQAAFGYLANGNAIQGGGTGALRLGATSGFPFPSNSSITFLNSRWGAVGLHQLEPYLSAGGTITGNVQTGNNYLSSPGFTSQILRVIPMPGGSANNPALADFCLVEFAPIPGLSDAVFGTVPGVGENVSGLGYGRWVAGGVDNGRDGNARMFNAPVSQFLTSGFNPALYFDTIVVPSDSRPILGRGYTGDSGGGVYDSLGRTLGIIVAGTNNLQHSGSSTVLRFDNPEVMAFIQTTIPSPAASSLLVLGGLLASRRRRSS